MNPIWMTAAERLVEVENEVHGPGDILPRRPHFSPRSTDALARRTLATLAPFDYAQRMQRDADDLLFRTGLGDVTTVGIRTTRAQPGTDSTLRSGCEVHADFRAIAWLACGSALTLGPNGYTFESPRSALYCCPMGSRPWQIQCPGEDEAVVRIMGVCALNAFKRFLMPDRQELPAAVRECQLPVRPGALGAPFPPIIPYPQAVVVPARIIVAVGNLASIAFVRRTALLSGFSMFQGTYDLLATFQSQPPVRLITVPAGDVPPLREMLVRQLGSAMIHDKL